jgi:hypothetical protein
MRPKLLIVVLLVGALGGMSLICYCGWNLHRHYAVEGDFERLLAGNKEVSVQSFEVEGRLITDPASVAYLSDQLRSAKAVAGRGPSSIPWSYADFGTSHHPILGLSTGGSVTCALYVGLKKDQLLILFPLDGMGDGVLYLVAFESPMPESISNLLGQLN